jgi:hypothetical protein
MTPPSEKMLGSRWVSADLGEAANSAAAGRTRVSLTPCRAVFRLAIWQWHCAATWIDGAAA